MAKSENSNENEKIIEKVICVKCDEALARDIAKKLLKVLEAIGKL